jgi:hypothetical protein
MKNIAEMDRRSFPYGIRMTVNPHSAGMLAKSVAFLAGNTGVRLVQVEPVFPRGRGKAMALTATAADLFIRSFREAHGLAASKGIELFYSGARPGVIASQFCAAPREALVVLQTGEVSTCFEVQSRNRCGASIRDQFSPREGTIGRSCGDELPPIQVFRPENKAFPPFTR